MHAHILQAFTVLHRRRQNGVYFTSAFAAQLAPAGISAGGSASHQTAGGPKFGAATSPYADLKGSVE